LDRVGDRRFDSIVDYLMDFDEKAAMRIAQRLIDCANSLAEFPQRGTPIGSDIRQMSLVYPYLLRYRVSKGRVEIVAIRHGARAG
jgi:toxin ParE1/3/4